MSTDRTNSASGRVISLRSLLLSTAVLTFLTVVLGVSTRAVGAGLACNANWPLCDGGILNLFPAGLPSFFEWFHRLVAGVTGIAILASVVATWRRTAPPLPRWTTAIAAILLPIQVLLGRETVLSFVPTVLAAHYWVAMGIYAAVVVATVVVWEEAIGERATRAGLGLALLLVPVVAVLSPPIVTTYSPAVQATQYVAILLAFAALLAATVRARVDASSRRFRIRLLAAALLPAMVFFGRQRIVDPDLPFALAHEVATIALLVVVLAAIGIDRRERGGVAPVGGDR